MSDCVKDFDRYGLRNLLSSSNRNLLSIRQEHQRPTLPTLPQSQFNTSMEIQLSKSRETARRFDQAADEALQLIRLLSRRCNVRQGSQTCQTDHQCPLRIFLFPTSGSLQLSTLPRSKFFPISAREIHGTSTETVPIARQIHFRRPHSFTPPRKVHLAYA